MLKPFWESVYLDAILDIAFMRPEGPLASTMKLKWWCRFTVGNWIFEGRLTRDWGVLEVLLAQFRAPPYHVTFRTTWIMQFF